MSALTNFLPSPNQTLGNPCQSFCSKSSSLNIFSRLIVGIAIKAVTVIAVHMLAGMEKLVFCTTKITYSIPAKSWSSIPNHQKIGKEELVHLGFSGFHSADRFICIANIKNKYP